MKLTAEEFIKRTLENPNWCSEITEPTEITEYLKLEDSEITTLSPLLIFVGRNKLGDTASFKGCKQLKIAEGTFHGYVGFSASGIEEIGDLKVIQPDEDGHAASFWKCKNLKIAQGTFPGHVNFEHAGIEEIGNLKVTQTTTQGDAARFRQCRNLKIATGTYPGYIDFRGSGIEQTKDLKVTQANALGQVANFEKCPNLQRVRGNFNGKIYAEKHVINEYHQYLASQKINHKKSKEPTLEI